MNFCLLTIDSVDSWISTQSKSEIVILVNAKPVKFLVLLLLITLLLLGLYIINETSTFRNNVKYRGPCWISMIIRSTVLFKSIDNRKDSHQRARRAAEPLFRPTRSSIFPVIYGRDGSLATTTKTKSKTPTTFVGNTLKSENIQLNRTTRKKKKRACCSQPPPSSSFILSFAHLVASMFTLLFL